MSRTTPDGFYTNKSLLIHPVLDKSMFCWKWQFVQMHKWRRYQADAINCADRIVLNILRVCHEICVITFLFVGNLFVYNLFVCFRWKLYSEDWSVESIWLKFLEIQGIKFFQLERVCRKIIIETDHRYNFIIKIYWSHLIR